MRLNTNRHRMTWLSRCCGAIWSRSHRPKDRDHLVAGAPSIFASSSGPLERIVDHAHEVRRGLLVAGPFGIEIRERFRGQHPCSLLPWATNSAMRSRAVTSMARKAATCALVAGPPRLDTILVVSFASARKASFAR